MAKNAQISNELENGNNRISKIKNFPSELNLYRFVRKTLLHFAHIISIIEEDSKQDNKQVERQKHERIYTTISK